MNTITDQTDSRQLKAIAEQRRQRIEEHQVSVIAGLLPALEAKAIISENISKSMELLT